MLWLTIRFINVAKGPTLGVFLLGVLFRKPDGKTTFVGCLCGFTLMIWIFTGSILYPGKPKILPLYQKNCSETALYFNESIFGHSIIYNTNLSHVHVDPNPRLLLTKNGTSTKNVLLNIYRISPVWYTPIGTTVTMLVSLFLSYVICRKHDQVNEEHVVTCKLRSSMCFGACGKKRTLATTRGKREYQQNVPLKETKE